MKNFLPYKQVIEVPPDTKITLLGGRKLESRGVVNHKAL